MNTKITYDSDISMFVAEDPYLRVFSQGVTEDRARANLEDAVRGFLFVAYKNGMLDGIMIQCNEPRDPMDW